MMIFLSEVCLKMETKNPIENSAGMVLSPKISITKAPKSGFALLAEVMRNTDVKPHGSSPFNAPNIKKLLILELRIVFCTMFLYHAILAMLRFSDIFIFVARSTPANIILEPAKRRNIPFEYSLNAIISPKYPKIKPSITYVATLPKE